MFESNAVQDPPSLLGAQLWHSAAPCSSTPYFCHFLACSSFLLTQENCVTWISLSLKTTAINLVTSESMCTCLLVPCLPQLDLSLLCPCSCPIDPPQKLLLKTSFPLTWNFLCCNDIMTVLQLYQVLLADWPLCFLPAIYSSFLSFLYYPH